jgi:uncharacterized protein (TIGR03000 family)
MYSVVLAMALTGSMDMPARCGRGGRHGGRHGGCSSGSCYGGHYAGGGGCGSGGGCGGGGYRVASAGCASCGGGMAYASAGPAVGCAGGLCYGVSLGSFGTAVVDAGAPATIVVTLPEDAKLLIDESPTTSTSGNRVFVSPSLPAGQEYHYTLKAEVVRDGKPVSVEQTVAVKAGEETRVTLTLPATGVASR